MAQPKSFTLDGKQHTLSAQVPAHEIEWVMGRVHVGLSDVEVHKLILPRCRTWPRHLADQAATFAVKCHRDNQVLFTHVNGGL